MPKTNGAKNQILIVEDDRGLSELVRDELAGVGMPLVQAFSGEEALRIMLDAPPVLLILDYSLPDMTASVLIERISSRFSGMPPFIITTGMGDERIAVEMMKTGARDYLVKDGKFLEHVSGVVRRVLREAETEHKLAEAERALRESDERYRSVVEYQTEFICRFLPGGRLTFVNQSCCQLAGKTREELMGGSGFPDLLSPDIRGEIEQKLDSISPENPAFDAEQRVILPDGAEQVIEWSIRGLFGPAGATREFQAIGRDVSRQRLVEEQLLQAQKMEAIGTLAGGIAHDFNNLLTGILGHAAILVKNLPLETDGLEAARAIEKAAERAAELTRQLLGFARRGKFLLQLVDARNLVTETATQLRRYLDQNINIVTELQTGQVAVLGDRGQMRQMLLNLALNARDAMPGGGTITLSMEIVDVDAEYCRLHPSEEPGTYVLISVRDTGRGIPRQMLDRIFEPFYTTKEVGKGVGMGLATVYGIAKNHGGFVTVTSEENSGSCFKVYLPLREAEAISAEPAAGGEEAPRESGARILVVDDEQVVREIVQSMLKILGHDAVIFEDGRQAVEYFREHWGEIDLVILDMIMPGIGGRECFRLMRQIHPGMRAVLSSGYALDGKAQEILDEGMIGFIQKPYRMSELGNLVAFALKSGAK